MNFIEKMKLAEQKDLPIKLMRELAKDEDWHVRRAIAWRDNLPLDLMQKLTGDADNIVKEVTL
jgi:hypothetical protein